MPLISYLCGCGRSIKKYFKGAKDAPTTIKCLCNLDAKKVFGSVSNSHLTVVDNGLMSRRLEIDPNIMEINDERSSRDYANEED